MSHRKKVAAIEEDSEQESPEGGDDQQVKRPYTRFSYTEEDLALAITRVKEGALSINRAAKIHGIPKGTLFNKVTGKVPLKRKMGPATVLSQTEEESVKNWILNMAKLGFPMHGEDVKDTIQKVLKECPRSTPFRDDRPGDTWLNNFLKRHPEISKRNSDAISKARALVTKESIVNWFTELRQFLGNNNCLDIFDDGRRVLNCDETGCITCPDTGKILGPKHFKNLYEVKQGSEKESITVLCCFSADGASLPPMLVYPYKRVPAAILRQLPDGWGFGRSDSGWMVSETFLGYVSKVLKPNKLEAQQVPFPVILFLDGHKSHLSMELANYCTENEIIIYCLPPNATDIIQPCDVSIFRPLKVAWRAMVRKTKHNRISINKTNFAGIFKQAFESIKPEVVKNGFNTCGLYPINENAIDYSKCLSVRQAEIEGQSSMRQAEIEGPSLKPIKESVNDHLSQSDYFTTQKVIEHIFPKEIEKFSAHIEGEIDEVGEHDHLFMLWKICHNRTSGLPPNSFCNTSADCPSSVNVNDQFDYQFVFDEDLNCIPLDDPVDATVSSFVSSTPLIGGLEAKEVSNEILNNSFLQPQPSHTLDSVVNVDVNDIDTWIAATSTCGNEEEIDVFETNKNNTKDYSATTIPIIDVASANEGVKDSMQLPIMNPCDNSRESPERDSRLHSSWSNYLKLPQKPTETSKKKKKPNVPFCITSAEWRGMQQKKK